MANMKGILYGDTLDDPSRVDSPQPEQQHPDMPSDIAAAFLNIRAQPGARRSPSRDSPSRSSPAPLMKSNDPKEEDITDDIAKAFLNMSTIPENIRDSSPSPGDHRPRGGSLRVGPTSPLSKTSLRSFSPQPSSSRSPLAVKSSAPHPFSANFRGHACPDILLRYFEFERKQINSETYFIAGFEWITKPIPQGTLNKWVAPNRSNQFLPFAQADSSGSIFALWVYPRMQKYQGTTVDKAPVVYFGNEGDAFVVAGSLEEFIALQATGMTGDDLASPPDLMSSSRLPMFDPEFDPLLSEGASLFRLFYAWAKQQGIISIPRQNVWKVIRTAQMRHPDVGLLKYLGGLS